MKVEHEKRNMYRSSKVFYVILLLTALEEIKGDDTEYGDELMIHYEIEEIARWKRATSSHSSVSFPGKAVDSTKTCIDDFRIAGLTKWWQVDLEYRRNIFLVLIKSEMTIDFKVKLKTETFLFDCVENDGERKMFNCYGNIGRYVRISSNQYTLQLCDVEIYTKIIAPTLSENIPIKLIGSYDPFSNGNMYAQQDKQNNDNFIVEFDASRSDEINFTPYDDIPMAFYKIQFPQTFHIFEMHVLSSFEEYSFYIAHRVDDKRKFINYHEDGNITMFENKRRSVNEWNVISFEESFIASQLRIHLMHQSTNLLKFFLKFKGMKSLTFNSENHYIYSGMITVPPNAYQHKIEISFKESYLVSGIRFDVAYDKKKKYLLFYNVGKATVIYRDNSNLQTNTMFYFTKQWVSLKPFVTTGLIIVVSGKGWDKEELFGVHLKGQQENFDSFHWSGKSLKSPEFRGIHIVNDIWNRNPLFGNMQNLQKNGSDQCLRTNHIGADCLSRPHLCDSGFTITIVTKGYMRNELSETYITVPDNFQEGSSGEYIIDYDQLKALALLFKNPLSYRYIEVRKATLEFKSKNDLKAEFSIGMAFRSTENIANVRKLDGKYKIGGPTTKCDLTSFFQSRFLQLTVNPFLAMEIYPEESADNNITLHDIKLEFFVVEKFVQQSERLKPKKEKFGSYPTKSIYTLSEGRKEIHYFEMKCCREYAINHITISGSNLSEIHMYVFDGTHCIGPLLKLKEVYKQIISYLPYPIIASKVCLETIPSIRNAKLLLYGSSVDYHNRQVFPIISIGVNGDETSSTGLGFTAYYRNDKTLYGLLKTNVSQFIVTYKTPEISEHNEIIQFIFVWNFKSLKLYRDGVKVGTSAKKSFEKVEKVQPEQEYILLYCSYSATKSFTNIELVNIQLANTPKLLFNSQNDGFFREIVPFTPSSNIPSGFHFAPFCLCWNAICPCDAKEELMTLTKERHEFIVQEVVGNTLKETFYKGTNFDFERKQNMIEFDSISIPNPFVSISNAYINISFNQNISNHTSCNLYTRNNIGVTWIINASHAGYIYMSPNIRELIVQESKINQDLPILRFYLSRDCLPEDTRINDGVLRIFYNSPSADMGIAASAAMSSPVHYTIDVQKMTQCLHFQLKFDGEGFAFISIIKYERHINRSAEVLRFYTKDRSTIWKIIAVNLSGNDYSKVQISGIKNGNGDGYVWIKKVMRTNEPCDTSPSQNVFANTENFETLSKVMFMNGFSLPAMFLPANDIMMPQGQFSNFKECKNAPCQLKYSVFSPQGYSYLYARRNARDSDNISWETGSYSNFTIAFWLRNSEISKAVIEVTDANNKTIFHIAPQAEHLSVASVYVSETFLFGPLENEDWYHIVITKSNKKLKIFQNPQLDSFEKDLNEEETSSNLNSTWKLVIDSYNVHCFQLYDKVLSDFELLQTQLCPNRFTTMACDGDATTCGVCNQLTGKWKLPLSKTQMYSATDTSCRHGIKKFGDFDSYLNFDTNKYGQLLDIYRQNVRINVDRSKTYLTPGVANKAICFKEVSSMNLQWQNSYHNKFFVSFWIRYQCSYKVRNAILKSSFFELFCNKESDLEIIYKNCRHVVKVFSGFWYYLSIVENENALTVLINGIRREVKKSCPDYEPKMIANNDSVITAGFLPLCIDELMYSKNVTENLLKNIFDLYINGIDNQAANIKSHQVPYYFHYFLKKSAWHDDLWVKGSFHYQNTVNKIVLQLTEFSSNRKFIRLIDSEQIKFSPINGSYFKATVAIYFDFVTTEAFKGFENTKTLLISHGYNVDMLLKKGNDFSLYEIASTSEYSVVYAYKTYMIMKWIQKKNIFKLPIIKLRVVVTKLINNTISSRLPNETVTLFTQGSDLIKITGLETFTLYEICFEPISWRGSNGASYLCSFKRNFKTAEGEPDEKPSFECVVKSSHLTMCNMTQISGWVGTPYSYEVYWISTKRFLRLNIDRKNSLEEFDFHLHGFHNLTIVYKPNTSFYEFNVTNKMVYENYTIIARATTRRGEGKGVYSFKYFRSGEGPPERPQGFNIALAGIHVIFSWDFPNNDVEFWNTDSYKKETWKFMLTYVDLIGRKPIDVYLQNPTTKFNVSEAVDDANIYAGYVRCISNGETGDSTKPLMFVPPLMKRPTIELEVNVPAAVEARSLPLKILHFDVNKWRGRNKYFYFLLYKESVEEEASSYLNKTISKGVKRKRRSVEMSHYNNKTELVKPNADSKEKESFLNSTEEKAPVKSSVKHLYPFNTDEKNSIKAYKLEKQFSFDFENVVNKSLPKDDSLINLYLTQNVSEVVQFHNLHPWTTYVIAIVACNELGCQEHGTKKYKSKTKVSTPEGSPKTVELKRDRNFALLVTFRDIDENDRMGPIDGYLVQLFLPYDNTTRIANTTNKYVSFTNVGIYKYTCAKVAGYNIGTSSDVMTGPLSKQSCIYTSEAEPLVVPEIDSVIHANSRFFKLVLKKPDENLMNGVLRQIKLLYNLTKDEIVFKTLEVNHREFFSTKEKFIIEIGGLRPFTIYEFQLAYVTVTNGSYSRPIYVRTIPDVPLFQPFNISVNTSSRHAIVTWDSIRDGDWNGPPKKYILKSVCYLRNLSKLVAWHNITPSVNTFNLSHLYPFTYYEISIAGCTQTGCTKFDNKTFNTSQDVPSGRITVSINETKTCLYLKWEEISIMNSNGIITGFHLLLNSSHNYTFGLQYEFTICNLYKGFRYQLALRAATAIGYGEVTKLNAMTIEDVPCPPSNINVFNQYGQYMQIWWTDVPWQCKNGDITGFVIYISEYVEERYFESLLPVSLGDPNQRTYKMYGLTRDLYYKFEVAAMTSKGIGNTTRAIIDDFGDIVDGAWSNWTDWTPCSVSCGPGISQRKRFCSEPPPQKGKQCEGIDKEEKNCRIKTCKGYYGDGLWTEFSPCTATCGLSQRKYRRRICNDEDGECDNDIIDSRSCGLKPCPQDGNWGEWGPISECNRECGGGNKTRTRKCNNPAPVFGGKLCIGPKREVMQLCNTHMCPQDGGWSEWEEWSACEKPCGVSKSTRRRACDNPVPLYRGRPCPIENGTEFVTCYLIECRSLEVVFFLQFNNLSWYYPMYDKRSPLAVPIVNNICKNFDEMNPMKNHTSGCHVYRLSRGISETIMGNFSSQFEFVDASHLVQFVDIFHEKAKLNKMHVGTFILNVPKIPCKPPDLIQSTPIDAMSVLLSWRLPNCSHATIIYVMYARIQAPSTTGEWLVRGVNTNNNGGPLTMELKFLKPGITYKAYLMQASQLGVGAPGKRFLIKSQPAAPTMKPVNLYAVSPNSYSIFLAWDDIPVEGWSGEFGGYFIKYKEYNDEFSSGGVSVEIPYGYNSFTLYDLLPYTLYMITVAGYNQIGIGPLEFINVETAQDVPSAPVPDIHVDNFQSTKWWSVKWNPLPVEKINGVLLGYQLNYFKSHDSDRAVGGEVIKTTVNVNKYTFYHKVNACRNFETYTVTVSGYTIQGNGPSNVYYAKTCRCAKYLFVNFYHKPPYVNVNSASNLTGFLPDLIKKFLIEACGTCEEYLESILRFDLSISGRNPNKQNKRKLIEEIDDSVDVSFPYYASRNRVEIVPGSAFVSVIPSPGLAVIVRDETLVELFVKRLVYLTLMIWPYLLVMYLIASIFGFIIWFADQFFNPKEFSIGQSKRGPFIGFWYSFVTMTTIGYGDLVPRSFLARLISIIWFVTGLVLSSIMLAYITTTFSSVADSKKVKLYNNKVGTLHHTFEYSYAVRKNAIVYGNYSNITTLLDDLKHRVTDVVLIDIYEMVGHQNAVNDRKLIIKHILDVETGYGFVLSSKSRKLKLELDTMIFSRQSVISEYTKYIEKMIPTVLPAKKEDVSSYIFSKDSSTFQMSVRVLSFSIAVLCLCGVIWNLTRCIKRRIRVGTTVNHSQSLKKLKPLLDCFPKVVKNSIECMEKFHDEELWRLITLKRVVRRYINEMGKEGTEEKISNLWHNRLVEYAFGEESQL